MYEYALFYVYERFGTVSLLKFILKNMILRKKKTWNTAYMIYAQKNPHRQ